MKSLISFFFLLLIHLIPIGCIRQSNITKEDASLLINNYVSDFQNKRWYVEQNTNNKTDLINVLPVLDSIIHELETFGRLTHYRDTIIQYLDKHKNKFNEERHPIDSFLIVHYQAFKTNSLTPIKELNFIDEFTDLIYWDTWTENYDLDGVINYIPNDTILLYENTHYDIPIRIENNETTCGQTIQSNSLQSKSKTKISFDTGSSSHTIQTVYFSCKVSNNLTREIQNFQDSLIIQVIAKNDR